MIIMMMMMMMMMTMITTLSMITWTVIYYHCERGYIFSTIIKGGHLGIRRRDMLWRLRRGGHHETLVGRARDPRPSHSFRFAI